MKHFFLVSNYYTHYTSAFFYNDGLVASSKLKIYCNITLLKEAHSVETGNEQVAYLIGNNRRLVSININLNADGLSAGDFHSYFIP